MSSRFRPIRTWHVAIPLFILGLFVLSTISGAIALYVDQFGDESSQVNIAFTGQSTDNSTIIRLPADSLVKATGLRVSGNAMNVSVDVGDDQITDWEFKGNGYGRMGKQTIFTDNSSTWSLTLAKGNSDTKDLILPRTANVVEARLKMDAGGTTNMSWSNDRYFSVQDGKNVVELNFENKAYLVPDLHDLDGDGVDDLLVGYQSAVTPSSGEISFYLGLGPGRSPSYEANNSFSSISIGQTYIHPELVDVDSDSDLDLVYGSIDGTIRFEKNEGTLQNPSWTTNGTLFSGIDVGDYSSPGFSDLNGDGKVDMVVGNSNGNFFFYNNTGAQDAPIFSEIPGFFSGISVNNYATPTFADIDGDNDDDMISGDGSGNVIMFQNNGTSTQPNIELNSTFFNGISQFNFRSTPTTFDADGDGDLDVCAGYADARLVIWKNQNGDGLPSPWSLFSDYTLGNTTSLFSSSSAIELVDLNGDGLEDLVEVTDDSRYITHDQITLPWGNNFAVNTSSFGGYKDPNPYNDPTFSDLDNDGDIDMLSGSAAGDLTFFRNAGTKNAPSYQKVSSWAPVSGINVLGYSAPELGDLDGNGLPDLVLGSEAGSISYYTNTGSANTPAFTSNATLFSSIDYGSGSRTVPELMDLDGDGDLDLIITYSSSSGWGTQPDVYLNSGTSKAPSFTFDTTLIADIGAITESGHMGQVDVENDGDMDLIMGGDPTQRLYVMENHPGYNLKVKVDTRSQDIDAMLVTSIYDIDITNIISQSLASSTAVNDSYGNPMSTLEMMIKATNSFKADFAIEINYTYGALIGNLVSVLNDYISANSQTADPDGLVAVPVSVSSDSDGTVRLFGLNISVDEPPKIVNSVMGLSVDEDTKNDQLIDLFTTFDDDLTGDNELIFGLEVSDSPINITLKQERWISVDAETGPSNDNWNGEVPIRINATDSSGLKTSTGFFNITIKPQNDPPVIHSIPPTFAVIDEVLSYQVNATDIDGDSLTYGLALNPNGMTINETSGALRWVPMDSDNGANDVRVTVTDGYVVVNQNFTLSVGPKPKPNNPPTIISEPVDIAYVGLIYQYNVQATDEDGDPLNYLLPPTTTPNGMMINFTDGVINWVPSISQIGVFNVTVVVTDGRDNATQNFSITVEEIDRAPQLTSIPRTNANVGLMYSYTVTAKDPEGQTLIFKLAGSPTGMTIDPQSGEIKWLPTADDFGTVAVKVQVMDVNNVIEQNFNIQVTYVQPQVIVTEPKDDQKVSGILTVRGTASILTGNIVKVQVKVDDKEWKDAKGTNEWAFKIDTTKVSNGIHSVMVRSVSEHTESSLRSVNFDVQNQGGSQGPSIFIMAILVILIVVIICAVVAMFILKKKAAEKKVAQDVASPSRGRQPAPEDDSGEDELSDDEMDRDLKEMEHELEGEIPSDKEMTKDLMMMKDEAQHDESE